VVCFDDCWHGCCRWFMWQVATKYPANALPHRPTLLEYIVSSKVCIVDSWLPSHVHRLSSRTTLTAYFVLLLHSTFYLFSWLVVNFVIKFCAGSWFRWSFMFEIFPLSLILCLQVKTTAQLDAALSLLATTGLENLDLKTFEEACGVGMVERTLPV